MKVKFLKKVRKRFDWHWDTQYNKWCLLDFNSPFVHYHYTSSDMMEDIIIDVLGWNRYINYKNKRRQITSMVEFRKTLDRHERKKPIKKRR